MKEYIIKEFKVYYDEESSKWFDDKQNDLRETLKDVFCVFHECKTSFEIVLKLIEQNKGAALIGLVLLGVKPLMDNLAKISIDSKLTEKMRKELKDNPGFQEFLRKRPKLTAMLQDSLNGGSRFHDLSIDDLLSLFREEDEAIERDEKMKEFSEKVEHIIKGWKE